MVRIDFPKMLFCAILLSLIFSPLKTRAFYFGGEKPLGLAGAYTAVADDTGAIFMNPAGISQVRGFQFDLSYETGKLDHSKLHGVSIVDSQTILLAAGLGYYRIKRDVGVSDKEEVYALALAERYRPNFLVGINVKHIKRRGPDAKDYTGDVGILYYYDPKVSFGLVGKNLLATEFEDVHKMYTGGIAYRTNFGLGLSFDLTKDADTTLEKDTIYSFGAELLTPDGVKLRGGYMTDKIEDKTYYAFNINFSSAGYSLGYSVMKDEADKDNVIQSISLKLLY